MSAKKLAEVGTPMTKDVLVANKLGIHARPAAMFVKTANRFSCDIFVEKDGEDIVPKSVRRFGIRGRAAMKGRTHEDFGVGRARSRLKKDVRHRERPLVGQLEAGFRQASLTVGAG